MLAPRDASEHPAGETAQEERLFFCGVCSAAAEAGLSAAETWGEKGARLHKKSTASNHDSRGESPHNRSENRRSVQTVGDSKTH